MRPQAVLGGVGGVEGQLDVVGVGPGDLAERLAVTGVTFSKYRPLDRRDPLPADVVVVAAATVIWLPGEPGCGYLMRAPLFGFGDHRLARHQESRWARPGFRNSATAVGGTDEHP